MLRTGEQNEREWISTNDAILKGDDVYVVGAKGFKGRKQKIILGI